MTKTLIIIAVVSLMGLAACGNDGASAPSPRPTATTCAAALAELAAARDETSIDALRIAKAKRNTRTACGTDDPR